jgi:hypothetical protein
LHSELCGELLGVAPDARRCRGHQVTDDPVVDARQLLRVPSPRRAERDVRILMPSPLEKCAGLGCSPSVFPADAADLILGPAQQITPLIFVHDNMMARSA